MRIRKAIVLLLMGASVGLCSCGSVQCKPVELAEDLSFSCEITQDEATYSADFDREGNAGWKAVFTTPETIEGLEIALFDDSCTVNFKGLSYTGSRDEFPELGMVSLITSAFDQCINAKVKCKESGSIITETGEVNGLEFQVKLKNGKPTTMEIPETLSVNIK